MRRKGRSMSAYMSPKQMWTNELHFYANFIDCVCFFKLDSSKFQPHLLSSLHMFVCLKAKCLLVSRNVNGVEPIQARHVRPEKKLIKPKF